jgi:hypothetical protein
MEDEMKAKVYFVELTKEQRETLQLGGWSSETGRAYLAAKDGKFETDTARGLMKLATEVEADDAEDIWKALQNLDRPWSEALPVPVLTTFPRSMDVGDIVLWADGRAERVASIGFEPVDAAFLS